MGGSPPAPAPPPPGSPPPPAPPPPAPPPPGPPPPPPPPPTGTLTSIPDVPFDYERAAGTATTTGTLPGTLNAGEVLAFTDQSVTLDAAMTCAGTEQDPAFVVGGTLTGVGDVFTLTGSWCIFDGTVFENIQLRTNGDHLIFRNIEVTNQQDKNGVSLGGSNIVLVDSEIHHNQGDDRHGIFVGSGADSVWILGNDVHHNGGDGFQACHGCSANPPRNIYLGNNTFHSDRENGIDFKYIEDVIVENNVVHSLVRAPADEEWCFDDGSSCGVFSSGSDGSAIVVGSDGAPNGVVIVGNEVTNTVHAVRIEEGIDVTIIDNNFHDIEGVCLQLDKEGYETVFEGNTCSNASRGIFQNWRVNFSLFVDNNIFENVTDPVIEYETTSVCESSTLVGNTFTNSGAVICSGRPPATTEAEINALPNASGNIVN
ncbi:MAG: right-handed parallel beta-helix repeat-containing protein [Gammaproteobacteria bacterium]|nr:right-handed parallel beta-helix repeat-containing protein [Gammaproteobacteria bacterium]